MDEQNLPQDETPADDGTTAQTRSPAPGRRPGRGVVIAIIIVAALVVIGIVVAIVVAVGAARADAARKDAAASVTAYLTAVAHGDADAALARLADPAALDRTLLTDGVLAASEKDAPITGIHVVVPSTGGSDAMTVAASYRIGSTPAAVRFGLRTDSAGAWRIIDGTGKVTVSVDGFTGMTLLLGGVKLTGSAELDAFPGTYALTTSTSGFTVAGEDRVTVQDGASSVSLASARPQLTAAGLQSYRFAIDKDVKGCISSKKLKTGCGLTLPAKLKDGTTLVDGSVQRSLPAATKTRLAAVQPKSAASDGVKLVADGLGAVRVTARCVKGGEKGTCEIANGSATYLGASTVDMSHKPLTVSWR